MTPQAVRHGPRHPRAARHARNTQAVRHGRQHPKPSGTADNTPKPPGTPGDTPKPSCVADTTPSRLARPTTPAGDPCRDEPAVYTPYPAHPPGMAGLYDFPPLAASVIHSREPVLCAQRSEPVRRRRAAPARAAW